jgi:hypothetical protein
VVVDDFHVMRVSVPPDKADAEPVIHTNAVLASSIATQSLEPVPGKDRQVPEFVRGVHLVQLSLRHASNDLMAASGPPAEEALRFLSLEGPDHRVI